MTQQAKKAFELLLNKGYFITIRMSRSGAERYCVYDDKSNPLVSISPTAFRSLNNVLVEKGYKSYVSKKLVRQLHGNTYLKKTYKNLKNETHA